MEILWIFFSWEFLKFYFQYKVDCAMLLEESSPLIDSIEANITEARAFTKHGVKELKKGKKKKKIFSEMFFL